jgi:hypothetical protein
MLLIDDLLLKLPAKGFMALMRKIQDMAEAELTDETKLKEQLLHLQLQFELDQISEEEFNIREQEIVERLNQVREQKKKQQA